MPTDALSDEREGRRLLPRIAGAALLLLASIAIVVLGPSRVADASSDLGTTIVAIAEAELNNSSRNFEWGATDNCTFYSGQVTGWPVCNDYGWRGGAKDYAWCANFVWWVWREAGVTPLDGIDSWAYSFAKYGAAHGTLHLPGTGYRPQPGDAVVFDWSPDPVPGLADQIDLSGIADYAPEKSKDIDHVGIVRNLSNGVVSTIEGNAGNHVTLHRYRTSDPQIRGYITPVGGGAVVPRPARVTAADFNGDGKADIAGIDADNNLMVTLGAGDGTLSGSTVTMMPGQVGFWAGFHAITSGDFNGDGKADIAGIDANNDMVAYFGTGSGTLSGSSGMGPEPGLWAGVHAIASGDFNGDGRADIAGIDANNTLLAYFGTGTGTLSDPSVLGPDPRPGTWAGFHAMTSGDFNGDGRDDIAGISANNDMVAYFGTGTGTLSGPSAMGPGSAEGAWAGFRAAVSGDFNGDGKDDVAGIDPSDNMIAYFGTGAGTLSGWLAMGPAAGAGEWAGFGAVATGDFNGDTHVDVVGIDAGQNMMAYLGLGDGRSSGWSPITPGAAPGAWAGFHGITSGDFNGDGIADLAGIDASNNMMVYAGSGDAALATWSPMMPGAAPGAWAGYRAITSGDFNGDGKADIAGIDGNNTMTVSFGTGAGTLLPRAWSLTRGARQASWAGFHDITSGDFNGDGKTDIAAIDSDDNLVAYYGTGAATLWGPLAMGPGSGKGLWAGFHGVTSGDFNADGKVDIAGIDGTDNMIVYFGTGTGTLSGSAVVGPVMTQGAWAGY